MCARMQAVMGRRRRGGRRSAMMTAPMALVLLSLQGPAAEPPLALWVGTGGAGSGGDADGLSSGAPLPSLAAAQARLRQALRQRPDRDVIVELKPGRHRVPPGGLALAEDDSPGGGSARVFWRGALHGASSLSGGEPVEGWQLLGDPALPGVYAAPAPPLPSGTARHLYIDGVRVSRTRVNSSLVAPPICHGSHCKAGISVNADQLSYSASSLLNWSNPIDVEFVYGVGMSEPRCSVDDLVHNTTSNSTVIRMKKQCMWNLVNRDWGNVRTPPTWIENVKEHLLLNPGSWYFDRAAHQVLYNPFPGQVMSPATQAVLAVEEVLVSYNGVRNHAWHNVSFEYATWLRPMQDAGFVEQQAGACNVCPYNVSVPSEGCGMNDDYVVTPGNVQISASTDLEFVGCRFRHLGANAASASNASQRIAFRGCHFSDISAGALMLGDTFNWNCNGGSSSFKGRGSTRPNKTCTASDPSTLDSHFIVEDCHLTNIPVEYKAATALFGGYVSSSVIRNNLIANTSYSGLTLGWGWGREAGGGGNNSLLANRLEGVMSDYCCDGGGLYTLGPQPGSTIARNHLVQPFRNDWPQPRQTCADGGSENGRANSSAFKGEPLPAGKYSGCSGKGIYHDNGSGGWNDTQNVIEGSWSRFIDVNFPWRGPIAYGPGNTSQTGGWNLCPGLDGATNHDCRINMTFNWFRMVRIDGNGNGGYGPCPSGSWYADHLPGKPRDDPSWSNTTEPCWINTENWMNGEIFRRNPSSSGWIHGVAWSTPSFGWPPTWPSSPPAARVLPAEAQRVVEEAGPRANAAARAWWTVPVER